MKKHCHHILLVLFVTFFAVNSARAAEDVLLPLPFEDILGRAESRWVSDSFSILLADLLDTPGLVVLLPDERNLACERAGVDPGRSRAPSHSPAASGRIVGFVQFGTGQPGRDCRGPFGPRRLGRNSGRPS